MRQLFSTEDNVISPLHALFRHLLEEVSADDPFELTARTGAAIGVAFVVAALANSAGIGGGLFWTPLFTSLCTLSLKASVALSQALVACGTVGASCYSILQHHPLDPTKPIIDYGLALVMMPALITGTSIGVLLNIIFPSIALVCILFTVLVGVAIRTLQQALKLRAVEKKKVALGREASMARIDTSPCIEGPGPALGGEFIEISDGGGRRCDLETLEPGPSINASMQGGDGGRQLSVAKQSGPSLAATGKRLSRVRSIPFKLSDLSHPILPWRYILEILLVAIVFLGFQIGKSYYVRCTYQYWTLLGVQIFLVIVTSLSLIWFHAHPLPPRAPDTEKDDSISGSVSVSAAASVASLSSSTRERNGHDDGSNENGYSNDPDGRLAGGRVVDKEEEDHPQATSWNRWHLSGVWVLVLIIGIIAGMVGLGGGVLISPLLLEFKVHPQTAAATSTLIVLFSSTIASVTFGLDDRLNLQYTAVYGPVCGVGGFVGVFVLSRLIKKYDMASLVTFMLAGLVVVSAGLVVGFAGRKAVENIINGVPVMLGDICAV